jgi:hypothetical protein
VKTEQNKNSEAVTYHLDLLTVSRSALVDLAHRQGFKRKHAYQQQDH